MEYKGELEGFPQEVVERMLECQVEQGNPENISVFEEDIFAPDDEGGFYWADTVEGNEFWCDIVEDRNFKLFFEKYPKNLINTYELW